MENNPTPTPEHLQSDPFFHIFLLKFYFNYTNPEERDNQKDTDYLNFEFGENTYTIQYSDLKLKADEEYLKWKENNPQAVAEDKEFKYLLKKV